MHELKVCDRQEEKGPFFPQCSYFLVQVVRLFQGARVINQHVSLPCAIPFHFHNKVNQCNLTLSVVAQGKQVGSVCTVMVERMTFMRTFSVASFLLFSTVRLHLNCILGFFCLSFNLA